MKTKAKKRKLKFKRGPFHLFCSGAILLDDLFKKTKTTPSIYWLPLTDEEIKQRDAAREERKRLREERRKAR